MFLFNLYQLYLLSDFLSDLTKAVETSMEAIEYITQHCHRYFIK